MKHETWFMLLTFVIYMGLGVVYLCLPLSSTTSVLMFNYGQDRHTESEQSERNAVQSSVIQIAGSLKTLLVPNTHPLATSFNDRTICVDRSSEFISTIESAINVALPLKPSDLTIFAKGFKYPEGLISDRQGNLYVADHHAGSISKVSPEGVSRIFVTGMDGAEALGIDNSGNIYVSCKSMHAVYKVSFDGKATEFFRVDSPGGLALAPNGDLYVGSWGKGKIYRVSPDGTDHEFGPQLPHVEGLTVDKSGNLYVGPDFPDTALYRITPSEQLEALLTGVSYIRGLTLDTEGNIYLSNAIDKTVYRLNPSTGLVTKLIQVTGNPSHLLIHGQELYLSDSDAGIVYKVALSKFQPKASVTSGPAVAPDKEDQCIPDAVLVTDVTVPDDSVVESGESFQKVWRLKNNGTCNWGDRYVLSLTKGDDLSSTDSQPLPRIVVSDETVDITIKMTAPAESGVYTSYWQMTDDKGVRFGDEIYVRIIVGAQSTTEIAKDTELYTNEQLGFSILYPKPNYCAIRS